METLSVAEHIAAGIPSPPRRATPPREVTLVPPRRRPFHVRGIIDERDFLPEPELLGIISSICAELFVITNTLIDEQKIALALSVMTAVIKTLRVVITDRKPDIKAAIQVMKLVRKSNGNERIVFSE